MKKLTKSLALIIAFIMLFSMLATSLVGCDRGGNDTDTSTDTNTDTQTDTSTDTGDTNNPDGSVDYTIQVKTVGGMPLANVTLTVLKNGVLQNFGNTDNNGMLTLNLPKSNDYTVSIRTAPNGYKFEESYKLYETGTVITTMSSVIDNPSNTLPSTPYQKGDIMMDFEVTTIDGETLKLSEILKTKKMVLLNFWFTTCGPCASEFPYMNSAYEKYKDDIEIIAINPYPTDTENAVKVYADSYELAFPVVKASYSWATAFNVSAYPTNILVDRYGMISIIEVGGITSETPFNLMFDYFTKPDGEFTQKIVNTLEEITPTETPNIDMPSSSEIGEAINSGDITIEYYPEDDEMSWPFIIKENENGEKYIFPANSGKMNSYAQINAKVTLKKGDVLAFDYLSNTEYTEDYADVLYVFADDKDIFQIVGVGDEWKTCFAFVADEDGEYEINLLYTKNEVMDNDPVNDGVSIKNMRIVTKDDINEPTYISRYAATQQNEDGFGFQKYANIVLDDDGFYRVCQNHEDGHECPKDGPYLLAELIGVTQFRLDTSITILMYEGLLGEEDSAKLLKYCNFASNSKYYGLSAVTEELKDLLIKITDIYGVDDDPNEWLQICEYYSAYGTEVQLDNPIKGLGTISAYTAVESTEENGYAKNTVEYDRPIMPRGLLYKFVPTKSGAYRITSNSSQEVLGWVFLDDKETAYAHSDMGERLAYVYTGNDLNNCTMVAYFEAGKEYYIDIAYYDIYAVGSFTFTINYLGESFEYFVVASPGFFTFEESENFNPDTLEGMGSTIAGGVDVMLGEDGYYYVKNEDGSQGSLLYADFLFPTNTFPSNTLQEIIEAGAFDMSKNGTDQEMLAYISSFEVQYILDEIEKTMDADAFNELNKDNALVDIINGKKDTDDTDLLADIEAYRAAFKADKSLALDGFKAMWGEDYEEYAELNQIEDVINGIYHGKRYPSENDQFILDKYTEFEAQYGDSWRDGFKALWGASYEAKYIEYKVEEVINGNYHGESYDLTERVKVYIDKMITEEDYPNNPELYGCVVVDKELAELLQALMDKFTFEGVDHSWTKLCYYYLHIGA